MKKIISMIIAAVMLCVLFGSLTFAQSSGDKAHMQYENTKLCTEMLESYEIEYAYMDIDDNGYEKIAVKLTDEESGLPYELRYYFHQSETTVSIRVWDFIKYDQDRLADVLAACNAANREWKYVTFVAEEDGTITLEMDQLCDLNNVQDVCWKAMLHIGNAVAGAYAEHFSELVVE